LTKYPRLAAIPLVTCDVATTLSASQIPELSVFPYLTPLGKENAHTKGKPDALLSVLQIASGICCPPNILVVDVTMLHDLPQLKSKQVKGEQLEKKSALKNEFGQGESSANTERGSEWFQALIQYLQTAGFKAAMGNSWAEMLQQIRHQSVDLILICLGESAVHKEVQKALKALPDLQLNLPPILVIDQRLNQVTNAEVSQPNKKGYQLLQNNHLVGGLADITGRIATQILPRSISMEDLLNQINQALVNGKNC
jgi:hypothetical protein